MNNSQKRRNKYLRNAEDKLAVSDLRQSLAMEESQLSLGLKKPNKSTRVQMQAAPNLSVTSVNDATPKSQQPF
jgi:hypothetical protein